MRNDAVNPKDLVESEQARLHEVVTDREVLAIQDTTELNYQRNSGRAKGLGTVGNDKCVGFFLHPMLVIDSHTHSCLGFSALHIENRLSGASANYPNLPIEEKESYRWIKTAEESKKVLSHAKQITFLGDRENDIYEFLDRIPGGNSKIITRACYNRRLSEGEKLFDSLSKAVSAGSYAIEIVKDSRKSQVKRRATIEVRYRKVEIIRPENCRDKAAPKSIELYLVEAKELNTPEGETAVHWRLLTTHEVDSFDYAKRIISWYQQRWNIEQVFRTLKKQGLNVESSQVEQAENLMKLAVMALSASIQILQLVKAREGNTEQKVADVFNGKQIQLLELLHKRYEGKTKKQQNPYDKDNLAWASWIIARIGGWKGYVKSEGLPGPIVMARGLEDFNKIYCGWVLAAFV
jgi:hypothetical protein